MVKKWSENAPKASKSRPSPFGNPLTAPDGTYLLDTEKETLNKEKGETSLARTLLIIKFILIGKGRYLFCVIKS